jgi:hypothetical protein
VSDTDWLVLFIMVAGFLGYATGVALIIMWEYWPWNWVSRLRRGHEN